MSQEVEQSVIKEREVEPIIENQEVDIDSVMVRLKELESMNGRLLKESSYNKGRFQNLKGKIEDDHINKLEDGGNFKDLYELEKKKRFEVEDTLKTSRKNGMQKDMRFKVSSLASDAHNVDDILAALPKKMLAMDEDTFEISGIEEAVNHVRENKPYFFAKNTSSGMMSGRPDGAPPKDKTLDERINENPNAVLNEVLANMLE